MTVVVVYTPEEDRMTWLRICSEKTANAKLTVHSIANDYTAAWLLYRTGEVDAILVARHDHIPHGPWVIVAAEVDENPRGVDTVPLQDRATPPHQRRPRPLDSER